HHTQQVGDGHSKSLTRSIPQSNIDGTRPDSIRLCIPHIQFVPDCFALKHTSTKNRVCHRLHLRYRIRRRTPPHHVRSLDAVGRPNAHTISPYGSRTEGPIWIV